MNGKKNSEKKLPRPAVPRRGPEAGTLVYSIMFKIRLKRSEDFQISNSRNHKVRYSDTMDPLPPRGAPAADHERKKFKKNFFAPPCPGEALRRGTFVYSIVFNIRLKHSEDFQVSDTRSTSVVRHNPGNST